MEARNVRWWFLAIALYFGVAGSAYLAAEQQTERMQRTVDETNRAILTAIGERDNALEMEQQWKSMYDLSVKEIAELKAENEALTAKLEDVTFGYDEVCEETGWDGSGTFRITHYCNCAACCGKWANGLTATGTTATEGRTVAVDPKVIPLGSKVKINGDIYIAEDTGVHGNAVDVFVNDHQEAVQRGMYYDTVSWKAS